VGRPRGHCGGDRRLYGGPELPHAREPTSRARLRSDTTAASANCHTDPNSDADTDADTNSDPDADPDANPDSNSDPDTNSDSNSDSDADTHTDARASVLARVLEEPPRCFQHILPLGTGLDLRRALDRPHLQRQ
jgi:hypothetical protein